MTRRDNGLPGSEWRRLTDLAPPLADHVLEILRDEGIAAYAAPTTGSTGAYLETQAHDRPRDEVFVGLNELDRARDLLDGVLPQLQAELDDDGTTRERGSDVASRVSTDDDVWAGIIAAYSAPAADPVGRWSATEDAPADTAVEDAPAPEVDAPADDTAPTTPRRAATGFEGIRAEVDAEREQREAAAAAVPPADDPHDHYVPPPPPPIPEGDTVTRLAWAGVIGGPLWIILATIVGWGAGGLSGLLAVLAFVGGFITLVARMGDDRPDDEDDGAVV